LACALALSVAPAAHAALELSTDNLPVAFGLMELEQERVLAERGDYHSEITCRSTNEQAWNLKISVLGPLSSGAETIPLENFGWQLSRTSGNGTTVGTSQFTPFSLFPELVYMSGPNEASGASVRLQFRYRLKIPERQVSGSYNTTIRFTLTEIL